MAPSTEKPSCLVAGGAGFIGSNLCRHLLARGYRVDCADNIITGRSSNVRDLDGNPDFQFLHLDVSDAYACRRLLRKRYSRIYHLACPTGVPNIAILGEEMMLASSTGTHNLLQIAKASGATFVFASSAEAYGDPQVSPQSEDYVGHVDPVGPRSPYEVGKRFGEAMTRYMGAKSGVSVRIMRIFNTYGPRMSPDDTRVIPQLLNCAVRGLPVPIYGDGHQTRTFLHVDDLLSAFDVIVANGIAGEVYNVGGASETRIIDLYRLVQQISDLPLEADFRPHFIADHASRWPDTAKVQRLGWRAQISLPVGIRRCYEEFRQSIPGKQYDALMMPAYDAAQTSAFHEQSL